MFISFDIRFTKANVIRKLNIFKTTIKPFSQFAGRIIT